MAEPQAAWRPGFFTTDRFHRALESARAPLVFRGTPIEWSVCGAPTVLLDGPGSGKRCKTCEQQSS